MGDSAGTGGSANDGDDAEGGIPGPVGGEVNDEDTDDEDDEMTLCLFI